MTSKRITISSWNVNSINARKEQILTFVIKSNPDIILLQETRCSNDNYPYGFTESIGYPYNAVYGQKARNGVAILSKYPITDINLVSFDSNPSEARYIDGVIEIDDYQKIRVGSVYIPQGQEVGSEVFAKKLEFLEHLLNFMRKRDLENDIVVLGGDFNVAPNNIDVYDPVKLRETVGFHTLEKRIMSNYTNYLCDSFRLIYPTVQKFTWWDYRDVFSFQKNHGMRLDHIFVSGKTVDMIEDVEIHEKIRTENKPSDHVPISCTINIPRK